MFDPFKILGLKKSYKVCPQELDRLYFEAQKQVHPDQHIDASPSDKREAIQKSSEVNQAYKLLKDPLERASVLLELLGVEALSEDPTFLMQVMEWNERREKGEDLTPLLIQEHSTLLKKLENQFDEKDYENARRSLYALTYLQKLIKDFHQLNKKVHNDAAVN